MAKKEEKKAAKKPVAAKRSASSAVEKDGKRKAAAPAAERKVRRKVEVHEKEEALRPVHHPSHGAVSHIITRNDAVMRKPCSDSIIIHRHNRFCLLYTSSILQFIISPSTPKTGPCPDLCFR